MNTVVITGASRGIGFAIAEIFAQNGYNLLLTSRSDINLYKAMETLQTKYEGIEMRAKAFDLSVKEEAIAFGNWCLQHGTPHILVNNTGSFEPGNIGDEADGILERQVATNLYSAYHVTRALLPAMKQQKSGHIFNMCSIASLKAYPNGGAYSISKYALHGFSTNLREELKTEGIKVTSVFPGAVLTDSWEGFDNSAKRIMEVTDVAEMVLAASKLSIAACVEDIVLRPQLGDL
ncbi:SDR family oxidoreductase [Niabella hibiscisoli]|uniref:SDR family oxidoreductase n=1 Tax=Niabella hibiscisoli TaxID=1825928 RepID=UPI001F0CEBDC|nr:SDR family oxidoreductase [Niabella hibiscisoli]MCH5715917.1 SDR family oxidoreductase [Niabella hibiscisoli]